MLDFAMWWIVTLEQTVEHARGIRRFGMLVLLLLLAVPAVLALIFGVVLDILKGMKH
jgi:hypothetical protein